MRTGVSVIVSTYNQPRYLALCLAGLTRQTFNDFEVLVADDGSGPATARMLRGAERRCPFPIRHIWQHDAGFRKCRVLNACIQAATRPYLVFFDGDCIPREDALAVHHSLRRPGRFLSGGYLKLTPEASARIDLPAVLSGRCFEPGWLSPDRGADLRVRLRLDRRTWVGRLADTLSPARASWNGHNASVWTADAVKINGFDERMGYGGEDREFGERLERAGIRGHQIRHRAPVIHLHHARDYVDIEDRRRNDVIRREGARSGSMTTPCGLDPERSLRSRPD